MSDSPYEKLLAFARDIAVLGSVREVLDWDQQTCMPPKGATWRSEQSARVAALAHEQFTSDEFGHLLAAAEAEHDPADPVQETNLREWRRQFDRQTRLPAQLVRDLTRVSTMAYEAWQQAKKGNDFPHFAPHLQRLLDLKRQEADAVGWADERYDALLDEYEPAARTKEVEQLFASLKTPLVDLVQAIAGAPRQPDRTLLRRPAPRARQEALNRDVTAALGFDYEAGRLDVSTHPFCSGFHPQDVRMTTRYDENALTGSLLSAMHETGHGLYEQGLNPVHAGTPMGSSISLGIHESQSRLWENQVGRSRPFWEHFLPRLQQLIPSLADVTLDDWVFALNDVRPGLTRTEADEVTYGLHIMLRFDLERALLDERIAVRDVPSAWNDASQALLGVTPGNDTEGCLQDIHWSFGVFGYFPTYQLGNLYAAQLYAAAREQLPELDEQIRRGELLPLREWLRNEVHQHGQRYRAKELVEKISGHAPDPQYFLDYLQAKLKPLYGL